MDSEPSQSFLHSTELEDRALEERLKLDPSTPKILPLAVKLHASEIEKTLKVKDLSSLSSGSFGKVYVSKDLEQDKTLHAIKVITCRYADDDYRKIFIKRAKREIHFLRTLTHQHIVEFSGEMWVNVEDEQAPSHVIIKTELLEADLWSRIDKDELSSDEVTRLITEIGSSIEYMHANRCVHNDIKPENIGMSGENEVFKLFDFGCTKLQSKSRDQRPLESDYFSGTLDYLSPKKRAKLPYDPYSADVYAFAITIVQSALGLENFNSLECEGPEHNFCDIIREQLCYLFNEEQCEMLCRMVGPEEECPLMSEVISVFT